ncbi:hypothetical protein BDZ97DRAFT_375673 [Flammula alnicola]|nr:hypothetical protein BDZ97DRAFT_375673 [Flammula alnicola]
MSSIPRLQTVSDPLPLAKRAFEEPSFDEWFQDNFQAVSAIGDDIPPPVVAEVSLESTTLDVDVYQYDCFPYLPGIRSTPPPAEPQHPASSFPLELPASTEKHANVSELDYLTITNGLLGQGITEQPGAEDFSLNFDLGSFVEPFDDTSFTTLMGPEVNQDLNFDFKSSSFPLDLQQWMEPFQGYDAPGLLFNGSLTPL